MILSEEEESLVSDIDATVNRILSQGGTDKELILLIPEVMTDELAYILASHDDSDLNAYCLEYKGFYRLMKLIEKLAENFF